MANRRNERGMPAEQGSRNPMTDDRVRDVGSGEDVRGIGDSDDEFEDTEDVEDTEEEDDEEEGSF